MHDHAEPSRGVIVVDFVFGDLILFIDLACGAICSVLAAARWRHRHQRPPWRGRRRCTESSCVKPATGAPKNHRRHAKQRIAATPPSPVGSGQEPMRGNVGSKCGGQESGDDPQQAAPFLARSADATATASRAALPAPAAGWRRGRATAWPDRRRSRRESRADCGSAFAWRG